MLKPIETDGYTSMAIIMKYASIVLQESANKKKQLTYDEFVRAVWIKGMQVNLTMDEIEIFTNSNIGDML